MNLWISTLLGAALGYVGGQVVRHPNIGAAVGAVGGYVLAGGGWPQLPSSSGGDVLQVPTTTITPGP